MLMFKILASLVLGLLGGYFFYRGIRIQNTKMIIWGVVLVILSYVPFMGGGDDEVTKKLIENALPSPNNSQQP